MEVDSYNDKPEIGGINSHFSDPMNALWIHLTWIPYHSCQEKAHYIFRQFKSIEMNWSMTQKSSHVSILIYIFVFHCISHRTKFMGPTWGPPVSCVPDGPHVGLMNLAIRVCDGQGLQGEKSLSSWHWYDPEGAHCHWHVRNGYGVLAIVMTRRKISATL